MQGGEALVALFPDLGPVVDHADAAEDQAQAQHHQRPVIMGGRHGGKGGQHRQRHGGDKDHTAHGGGVLLSLVPGGAVLQDLLAELQLPELFDDDGCHQGGQHERQARRLQQIGQLTHIRSPVL